MSSGSRPGVALVRRHGALDLEALHRERDPVAHRQRQPERIRLDAAAGEPLVADGQAHHPAPDRDHLEVHLAGHRVDQRARRREEVRAVVQPVVAVRLGADAATEPVGRLEQEHIAVPQPPCRGQAGDAAADDDHVAPFDGSDPSSTVPPGSGPRSYARRQRPSDTACAITASNIGTVRRPVNVFCWLGWYDPTSRYGPTSYDTPCPNRGFGRRRVAQGPERPERRVPAERAERQDDPQLGQQRDLAGEERRARVALVVRGLVERRRAADGGGDVGIGQGQAVIRAARRRPVRQARRRAAPPTGSRRTCRR